MNFYKRKLKVLLKKLKKKRIMVKNLWPNYKKQKEKTVIWNSC